MSELQNTIKELKDIINDLKTQTDKGTAWTGNDKDEMEKRIKHVNDKSQPPHTNLTNGLKFDVKDLENLETLITSDKLQWATEKSALEKAKTDAEKAKKDKETELTTEKENHQKTKLEVADKLTSDLVNGLNTLINTGLKKPKKNADGTDMKDNHGNLIYEEIFDASKLDAIKTITEELKTKGLSADLSKLDDKFKEVKDKVDEVKPKGETAGTNYWSIGACVAGIIAMPLLIYIAFIKTSKSSKEAPELD